jgi:hypothetical protein
LPEKPPWRYRQAGYQVARTTTACRNLLLSNEEIQSAMQAKTYLIDAIRSLNPTASATWLDSFESDFLRSYLDHLLTANAPRGNSWVRPNETPAMMAA